MEYYYTDGTANFGPFSLEQLREKHITASTKVWYAGLSGWIPAGEVPELSGILSYGSVPPPVPPPAQTYAQPSYAQQAPANMMGKPPKTWLVESILVTLFCCLPFGIAGIIFASRVESKFYSGDVLGAQQASADAGKWTKIGFWCGLVMGVLAMIYYVFIVGFILKNSGNLPSNF